MKIFPRKIKAKITKSRKNNQLTSHRMCNKRKKIKIKKMNKMTKMETISLNE